MLTRSGSPGCRAALLGQSLPKALFLCFTRQARPLQRTQRRHYSSASWPSLYLLQARAESVSSASAPPEARKSVGHVAGTRRVEFAETSDLAASSVLLVEKSDGEEGDGSQSGFLAPGNVTWNSLGLTPLVSQVLEQAGFSRPSSVQAAAVPEILSGRDVVVAAQTGSGKTLAYLAPIAQMLVEERARSLNSSPPQEGSPSGDSSAGEWAGAGRGGGAAAEESRSRSRGRLRKFALVLCPNATLCQQVAAMARELRHAGGEPLLRVHSLSGGEAWPLEPPDLVVATAAALLNNLFMFDPKRRRRSAFVRDIKCVVVDEADMLLSGGYARDVGRLLGLFRFEEKEQSERRQAEPWPAPEAEQPWTRFRLEQSPEAAAGEGDHGQQRGEEDGDGGQRGKEEEKEEEEEEDDLSWADAEWEEGAEGRRSAEAEEGGDGVRRDAHGHASSSGRSSLTPSPSCGATGAKREEGWRRSRKEYVRSKQYVFVAATLPGGGKRTVGETLRKQFPDAVWSTGEHLHCNNPLLEQRWVEVSVETRVPFLLEALQGSMAEAADGGGGPAPRVMVFANSAESADAIGRVLARCGLPCLRFHRDVPLPERMAALERMQREGGVLVCTDAAARGVDIPRVAHVIQAEFALSAVDFLHRVGRTARAGLPGRVTSLYTAGSKDLVEAVRAAGEAGQPVEGAFSRKRSFRKKFKKFGPSRRGTPRTED